MKANSLEKHFPIEIVDMILDMLSLSDLLRFSMISKAYFFHITQFYPNYWKLLYQRRWKNINFCDQCVSMRCGCSYGKMNRDWKTKYLGRLVFEDEYNAGGYTPIDQENYAACKYIVC